MLESIKVIFEPNKCIVCNRWLMRGKKACYACGELHPASTDIDVSRTLFWMFAVIFSPIAYESIQYFEMFALFLFIPVTVIILFSIYRLYIIFYQRLVNFLNKSKNHGGDPYKISIFNIAVRAFALYYSGKAFLLSYEIISNIII